MINRCVIVGRLTKDPELKYTPSGVPVTRFTIAVNRTFANQQGEREADFISCVAWRKQAENLANFMKKGNRIAVTGSIQTSSYEKDGQRFYVTEVNVNNIEFLDYRENAQNGSNSAPNYQGNTNYQSSNQNAYSGQNQPNNDPFSGYSSLPDDIDDNLPF